MNEITEKMVEAAMLKLGPLFNYYNDEMAHANFVRCALSAALAAAEAQEPVAWQPKYKQDVIDHHCSLGGDVWEYAMTVYPTKQGAEGYGIGGHEVRPLYTRPSPPSGEAVEARRLALEEAAVIADEHAEAWGPAMRSPAVVIATAIRALTQKDKADG